MNKPYGMGLLLLAMTLLLVTLGITTAFNSGFLYLLELGILLIIQFLVFVMLFAEKKWNYSHVSLLIVGVITLAVLIRAVLIGITNLEILLLIALSLSGFVIVIMDKTPARRIVAAKAQTRLDTYDPIQTYDLNQTNYFEPTTRMTQAEIKVKKPKKKTVKKSISKKVAEPKRKRGRPRKNP